MVNFHVVHDNVKGKFVTLYFSIIYGGISPLGVFAVPVNWSPSILEIIKQGVFIALVGFVTNRSIST